MVALVFGKPPIVVQEATRSTRRDYVSIVEAAYELDRADESWLGNLIRTALPALDSGHGAYGYFYDHRDNVNHVPIIIFHNCHDRLGEALADATRMIDPADLAKMHVGAPSTRMSVVLGSDGDYGQRADTRRFAELVGVDDVILVRGSSADGSGCMLGAPAARGTRLSSRTMATMGLVAAHLASATRLRFAFDRNAVSDPSKVSDAIFSPTGRLLHANEPAKPKTAADALCRAVAAMEESRGPLRRREPEKAVQIWQALVEGRWSMLDYFDRDGKRFILARSNASDIQPRAGLSQLERQILSYAAAGHSNKFIAYELGVSPPLVSVSLKSGLRRLGLRSRAELSRLLQSSDSREALDDSTFSDGANLSESTRGRTS